MYKNRIKFINVTMYHYSTIVTIVIEGANYRVQLVSVLPNMVGGTEHEGSWLRPSLWAW